MDLIIQGAEVETRDLKDRPHWFLSISAMSRTDPVVHTYVGDLIAHGAA